MDGKRRLTLQAIRACAAWLRFCLDVGWKRNQLDQLEDLWWTYHDDRGALSSSPLIVPERET